MNRELPKLAFAAREAYEALRELKKVIDDAAKATHAAELESFHVAVIHAENDVVRVTLRHVRDRLASPDFELVLSQVFRKLEVAIST